MAYRSSSSAKRKFFFGHINAESLVAHLHDVQSLISRYNPLVLGISESFLKPDKHQDAAAMIPHYKLLRHDRLHKGRGGVAMYVHESARCRIVGSSDIPGKDQIRPEFLLAHLVIGRVKILCALVYNPPKAGY